MRLPEVPVTVTVKAPVDAEVSAESVSVLLAAVGFGMNDAVTPVGKPDAVNTTFPLKPFCGVMVIALVPAFPCTMLTLFGEGESENEGFCAEAGQLLTKFVALTVPMPVAKSQPVLVL